MDLSLLRFATGKESTLGAMYRVKDPQGQSDFPVSFRCFTIEDQPNEPKVPKETRIPAGRYRILLRTVGGMNDRYTAKFPFHKGMLWLQDVPDFKWIYIHYGNYDDDTEGCILVGDGAQSNVIDDGMIMSSVAAYTRLYAEIIEAMDRSEEVWITIEDYA